VACRNGPSSNFTSVSENGNAVNGTTAGPFVRTFLLSGEEQPVNVKNVTKQISKSLRNFSIVFHFKGLII
jgi:hypothetical protein